MPRPVSALTPLFYALKISAPVRPIRSDEQQSSGNGQDASTKGGHDQRRRGVAGEAVLLLRVPSVRSEYVQPIVNIVPLQLLSYHPA